MMSNSVVKMPNQNRALDEASEWVAKFDRGLDADQERAFQKWVCSDAENYETFMSMAKLWDGMDELSRLSDLFPDPVTESQPNILTALFTPRAMAALFTFFIITASLIVSNTIQLSDHSVERFYQTSIGEHSTINLSDGSILKLNTNSLVRIDFNNSHRLVTLERGEIHIDVAHDKSRPLSVKAGNKVVQAVGTAFNVELISDKEFELIVVDGEVRVGDRIAFEDKMRNGDVRGQKKVVLKPVRLNTSSLSVSKGEKAILGQNKPIMEKIAEKDIEKNLLWRTGNIVFKGETLEMVIAEISRYTPVEFIIMDPEIKNVQLAGLFKIGDVNGLLIALEESFDIASEREDKSLIKLFAQPQ